MGGCEIPLVLDRKIERIKNKFFKSYGEKRYLTLMGKHLFYCFD
jgi:hypothetical protein